MNARIQDYKPLGRLPKLALPISAIAPLEKDQIVSFPREISNDLMFGKYSKTSKSLFAITPLFCEKST
jgi:hypothetical protein